METKHGSMSEYFVWKDGKCVMQTSFVGEFADFLVEHEDHLDTMSFMRIITSVSSIDDEELGFIKDFGRRRNEGA